MDANAFAFKIDPAVALPTVSIPQFKSKAFYAKLEFVVEIVGPRTISATLAKAALRQDWQSALARPKVVGMSPADTEWQLISDKTLAQVFDSLAFCWPFITAKGSLTNASAAHLLSVSESYANQVQRRAIPHLPVEDVEVRVADLSAIADELDFGIGFTLSSPFGAIQELRIWETAANLGMDLSSNGEFVWRVEGHEDPLFTLSSLGQADSFSLLGAKSNQLHPALSLGLRIPLCPIPEQTFEALYHAAVVFASRLGLEILDEEGAKLAANSIGSLRMAVGSAVETLRRAGIVPGSPEARLIFA